MTTTIALENVGVSFGQVRPIDGINLKFDAGELVGVVGPSGAGKTTLLRLLLGEISATSGTVEVSRGTGRARRAVGYVPQLEASERSFPLTVHGSVLLGAAATSAPLPWFSRAEKRAADATLERLGIAHLSGRGLHELSGGQFQRVLVARALASKPQLLLLDEPTSGIDLATRAEMLTLVGDLARDGLTVILTTHDLNLVAAHLPRIVCLNQTIRADGSPMEVFRPDVLAATFGADMVVIEHDGRPVIVDRNGLWDAHESPA